MPTFAQHITGTQPLGYLPTLRRGARRLRGRIAELCGPDCEHRNTHRPLAYLEKCWTCRATRRDGGAWIRGVR